MKRRTVISYDKMFIIGLSGLKSGFDPLIIIVLALALEPIFGKVFNLETWIINPINIIRRYANWCDTKLNRESRSQSDRGIRGGLSLLLIILVLAGVGWIFGNFSQTIPLLWIIELGLIMFVISQYSTYLRMLKAGRCISVNDSQEAIRQLNFLLGNNIKEKLAEENISGLCLEVCSTVLVKRVIAPVFWYLLFGLPGILVYIGVALMNEQFSYNKIRFNAFGFAAAQFHNIIVYVPAILSGLFIVISSVFSPKASPITAIRLMFVFSREQAYSWSTFPIGAMSGALNVALGDSKNIFGGVISPIAKEKGDFLPTPADVIRGIFLFCITCLINLGCVAILTVVRML